jgi:hypothetical protein
MRGWLSKSTALGWPSSGSAPPRREALSQKRRVSMSMTAGAARWFNGGRPARHMPATAARPNPEQLTSVAPVIRRSRS